MSERVATLLFTLVALGEMAVGALIAAFPAIGSLLIGAPIEGSGLLVARMLGVAVLALGLSWWLARAEPARRSPLVPGFLLYNLGVGALFGVAAASASQPLLPWVLAAVHVASGATFAAATALSPAQATRP